METARILIALSLIAPMYGCAPRENENTTKRLNELSEQIVALKAELDVATKTVAELKMDASVRDVMQGFKSIAYLRPGDEGYSLVSTDLGVLTVQMTDIKPYANGSKVTVKFGNPLAAAIEGLKAKVEWGRVDENGARLDGPTKSKDLKLTQQINAGAWSATSVVLDDIPPAELGFVQIANISHTGIKLIVK